MPHAVKPPVDTDRKADAFISAVPSAPPDQTAGKTVVNLRFDSVLLQRIDAAAKRQGISRTAWLHVAAWRVLVE
jgi:hypothetical protein